MSRITPYRTAGKLETTKPKDTYGLLIAPKPIPPPPPPAPHVCKLPTWFTHLIYFLKGKSITPGSLFRCEGCKNLYKYYKTPYEHEFKWREVSSYDSKKAWKQLGGDIAEEK